MEWIRENWLWLAFLVVFVWLHVRMHAGHGRHGTDSQRGGHAGCCGSASDRHTHDDAVPRQRREDAQR